jgi:ATP-dependent RNA helicase DeaD
VPAIDIAAALAKLARGDEPLLLEEAGPRAEAGVEGPRIRATSVRPGPFGRESFATATSARRVRRAKASPSRARASRRSA